MGCGCCCRAWAAAPAGMCAKQDGVQLPSAAMPCGRRPGRCGCPGWASAFGMAAAKCQGGGCFAAAAAAAGITAGTAAGIATGGWQCSAACNDATPGLWLLLPPQWGYWGYCRDALCRPPTSPRAMCTVPPTPPARPHLCTPCPMLTPAACPPLHSSFVPSSHGLQKAWI